MRWQLLSAAALVVAGIFVSQLGAATPKGSPGQIVFFSQHGGEDEIWVMDADGANKRNLTRHDGEKVSDLDPRWSPDGRRIAFARDKGGSRQIWVMDADGSNASQLTSGPGRNRFPSWTDNGRSIVFESSLGTNSEIYSVAVDGTGLTNLTNDPAADISPSTAPNGRKIVFTSERDGNGHLYVRDDDGTVTRITNGSGYDFFAAWSSRSNDIVFSRVSGTEVDLYLVHSDGTGERPLTSTPGVSEYFPAFSPDGREVVYSSCTRNPAGVLPGLRCSIHRIGIDGTGDVSLAFAPLSLPFPLTDDFEANTRNVDLWSIIHDGTGGFVNWANGRMELSIAANAAAVPGQPTIGAHVGANCLLMGDFDVQVDYELLTWPAGNNVNAGIQAFFTNGAIDRATQSWGETYNTFLNPVFNSVTTSDQAGSLRLVRSGATMTSYYKSDGSWIQLGTGPAQQTTAIVALSFKNYGNFEFGQQATTVAFDNFRLDATNVDCSSHRPDFHPDWRPVTPKSAS